MEDPNYVLIASVSPNGNMEAVVEQYEDCCYFYLHGVPETEAPLRSCWVRNLRAAPTALEVARMRAGRAPMLPAHSCAHPQGAAPLQAKDIEIVWFEEGDAAALLERSEVLCLVPAWAGTKGFEGFARDCIQDNPLCWSLGSAETNVLFERVRRARSWWASWETANPWTPIQGSMIDALERTLGKHTNYYGIDGGNWPPQAMLRFKNRRGVVLATCGVAIRPQPTVEMAVKDPSSLRRIELGMAVDDSAFSAAGEQVMGYLSGQAKLPWTRHTWLGPGHTIPCDAFAGAGANRVFTAVVLARQPRGAPAVALPSLRNDPVNLLWAVPISEREREFAMASGSTALLERLAGAGHGWMHSLRDAVVP
jgi:hypothetical protein